MTNKQILDWRQRSGRSTTESEARFALGILMSEWNLDQPAQLHNGGWSFSTPFGDRCELVRCGTKIQACVGGIESPWVDIVRLIGLQS